MIKNWNSLEENHLIHIWHLSDEHLGTGFQWERVVKCGHQRQLCFGEWTSYTDPTAFSATDMILRARKRIVAALQRYSMEYSRRDNAQPHNIDKSWITVVDILSDRTSWMNAHGLQTVQLRGNSWDGVEFRREPWKVSPRTENDFRLSLLSLSLSAVVMSYLQCLQSRETSIV